MPCFEWVSSRALPARYDLRTRGWRLGDETCLDSGCARLVDGTSPDFPEPPDSTARGRSFVLEVEASRDRARWLGYGFAEALAPETCLDELDARARRLIARGPASEAPRRAHGRFHLRLDLRDAVTNGRRLFLSPTEFALLSRLIAAGGASVSRDELYRDVFDLAFDPGTNRLAVHVCRMRKKLARARIAQLLVTGPGDGGYALVIEQPERNALDDPAETGKEWAVFEEAAE